MNWLTEFLSYLGDYLLDSSYDRYRKNTTTPDNMLIWLIKRAAIYLLIVYTLYCLYARYLQYIPQAFKNLYL